MRSIKVTTSDGDHFPTNINGTDLEILRYYLGNWTSRGENDFGQKEYMVQFDSVQFLDEKSGIVNYYEANGLSATISEGWYGHLLIYDLRGEGRNAEPQNQHICYWGNYTPTISRAFEEAEHNVRKVFPNALLVKAIFVPKGKERELLIFGPSPVKS